MNVEMQMPAGDFTKHFEMCLTADGQPLIPPMMRCKYCIMAKASDDNVSAKFLPVNPAVAHIHWQECKHLPFSPPPTKHMPVYTNPFATGNSPNYYYTCHHSPVMIDDSQSSSFSMTRETHNSVDANIPNGSRRHVHATYGSQNLEGLDEGVSTESCKIMNILPEDWKESIAISRRAANLVSGKGNQPSQHGATAFEAIRKSYKSKEAATNSTPRKRQSLQKPFEAPKKRSKPSSSYDDDDETGAAQGKPGDASLHSLQVRVALLEHELRDVRLNYSAQIHELERKMEKMQKEKERQAQTNQQFSQHLQSCVERQQVLNNAILKWIQDKKFDNDLVEAIMGSSCSEPDIFEEP